ncbi:urease accessory protein UreD [Nocardiopsis coralli]|uniref:urease accessory protein UreD n=1 Tax=Nocardiopsis coralli TaxID=2772213 RepID=UPI001F3FE2AC|nr:urease accessory protein UreD [Nocardiopsis coralli]
MKESVPARITVERVGGRVRLTDLSGGTYLRAQPLGVRGDTARVALVGTYALLLTGDRLRMEITVGPGVWLELVEPSGMVAYDTRGAGPASWQADLRVGDGACLVWRSAPFVVSAGADVTRRTRIDVAGSGRALVHETLVLGRSYEAGGGPLRSTVSGRVGGRPVLVEDLDLRGPGSGEVPGVMGGHRVLSSTFLLGARPERATGAGETLLHGPGALARALAGQAHEAESAVAVTWENWKAAFMDPSRYETTSEPGPAAGARTSTGEVPDPADPVGPGLQ